MPIPRRKTSPIVLELRAPPRYNSRMALDADAFRRLCRARELLCEPHDPPPSIREVARASGM